MTKPALIVGASTIMATALVVPLLFTSVPPFCDLYFHIARMIVLGHADAPFVRDWYAPDWQLVPNLAMDAIVPTLAAVMPILIAVKIFVATTLVLIFSGTIALHHALYKRLSWFPLVAGLFVYNQIVFIGYFNYLFGIGLSLWAAAGWFYLRRHPLAVRVAVASLLALLLYLSHLFAVALFGLLIASSEFGAMLRDRKFFPHAVATVLPFVLPLALLLYSRTVETAGGAKVEYWPVVKLLAIFTPFTTINPPIDMLVLGAVAVAGCAVVAAHALHVSHHMRLAVMAFPLLLVAVPTGLIGAFHADLRIPVAAIFVVIAACRFRRHHLLQLCTATLAGAVFLLRMTALSVDFQVAGSEVDEIREAFQQMTPGAVIFTGTLHNKSFFVDALTTARQWNGLLGREDTLPLTHLTTVALVDQAVFVPQTLMIDGQQPVKMYPQFQKLKALQADDLGHWYSYHDAHALKDSDEVADWIRQIRTTLNSSAYRFAAVYVALVDPDAIATLPPNAAEVYAKHGYRLWDISALVFQRAAS